MPWMQCHDSGMVRVSGSEVAVFETARDFINNCHASTFSALHRMVQSQEQLLFP
jgi:hypothetical protein